MQANIPYMDLMGKLDMFNSDVMFLGFDKKNQGAQIKTYEQTYLVRGFNPIEKY